MTSTDAGPLAAVDDMSHGSTTIMDVSGTNASGGYNLMVPDGGYVYGIEMKERANKPCYVSLRWATYDDGDPTYSASSFNRCDGNPTNSSRTYANISTSETAPRALKGIQVCQRNSNDRAKGLRVRGVDLSNTGGSTIRTRPYKRTNGRWVENDDQQTNCNDWDDMVMCPNQQVVVGVRIEGNDLGFGNRAQVKGLAPICAPIEFER